MTTVYVQFADSTESVVVAVFGCAQDAKAFPNQAALPDTDPRYLAYVDPASTLTGAQAAQVALVTAAYQSAVQQPVAFTNKAGTAETYQADATSQQLLMQATQGYTIGGAVPDGFYWKASDNTHVPFVLADLQGLYDVMLAQGWAAFQKLQTLKTSIAAATTVAAVQAIVWTS